MDGVTTMLAEGADPIAPWVQLVIQAGALGLLVLLVVRGLPALKAWREETEASHKEERKQAREDNKESLEAVLRHCDEAARRRDGDLQNLQSELENIQEQIELLGGRGRRRAPRPPEAT